MNSCTFGAGSEFCIDGDNYTVIDSSGRSRTIRNSASGETSKVTVTRLTAAARDGNLVLNDLFADQARAVGRAEIPASLRSYPPKYQEQAMFRANLLRTVAPRMQVSVPRRQLAHAIEDACKSLDADARGVKPPSVSTFYEWLCRFRRAGGAASALVDQVHLRGRRPAPVPHELVPVLDRVIQTQYLTGNRASISSTLEHALQEVKLQNDARPESCRLPLPTRRMIERLIGRIDRYEVIRSRHGKAVADRATRVYSKSAPPDRIGARVEVDHTPLDLLCVDDALGVVLGRPYLTVLIDVSTRVIMGLWISFREPSANSVLRALKHSILPKTGLLKSLGIKAAWPAQGVPSVLVLDNGKEFHSADVDKAASDLGITLVYCPPRAPVYKGTVERWLKEINYNFASLLPGATFAKYYLRGEYDSMSNCVLSESELRRLVYRWVVEVYHHQFHRGLGMCPLQKWKELARDKRHGRSLVPPLPANLDVLDVYLAPLCTRTLSSKGIELNSQHYGGPRISELRARLGNVQLEVRPNPDDLGFVHVLDPETKTYFKATNLCPNYASGVSLEQHEIIRRHAREQYKSLPHLEGLLAAKHQMREEVRLMLLDRQRQRQTVEEADKKGRVKEKVKTTALDRKPKSGIEAQSRSEMVADVQNRLSKEPAAAIDFSFDGIEGFPSGQMDLI